MTWERLGIRQRDFQATVTDHGRRVRLSGNADGAAVAAFGGLVDDIHKAHDRFAGDAVTIDLHELEFMSASCFKVLVGWIAQIQDLEPGARYRLCFRANPGIAWQARSLRTLTCFATDLISVVPA
ncbi:MAG: hypothetical protein KF773_22195 [Deltaproteobacteria bacterium]|nr:hypothetical protein [Deltaproteobacteria bacterium]